MSQNNSRVSDMRVGGGSGKSTPSSVKLISNDNGDMSEGMHPPSTTSSYSSILSPYIAHYRNSVFDSQRGVSVTGGGGQGPPTSSSPYDHPPPRKRHHRSPSDSNQRASVLRVGSLPERESPLPLTYPSPLLSPHEYSQQFHRDRETDRSNDHLDSSNSSTLPFTQNESVAVESTASTTSQNSRSSPDWRGKAQESSSSCPEGELCQTCTYL